MRCNGSISLNAMINRLFKDLFVDPEAHEYWLHDIRLPSVTDTLDPLVNYDGVMARVLERKRQIGQALHECIALGDKLDSDSVDPLVLPYFQAWQKFLSESGFVPHEHEISGFHQLYQFAGTWDLVGDLNGKLALLDTKTTAVISPVNGLQTAAYKAIRDQGQRRKIQQRFTLQLKPDASYRLQEHDDPRDFSVFLACLTWHNFKCKNNL